MCDEWALVRLADHVDIAIGGTPSRAVPAFWIEKPAGHPWLAISDLKGKYLSDSREHISDLGVHSSNVKLIPTGSTVMSFKLSVGRTGITTAPMYSNEAIAAFLPRTGAVDGTWLHHVLPRAAGTVVTDSAVKGATLNKAKMAEMTVLLPSPAEQRTIASVLDTLDTTIRQTEAIIEKLKQIKQGLLHDLLTRGIDANGELRPPQSQAPHLYKDSPLGWIPREWESLALLSKIALPKGQVDPRFPPHCDWVLIAPDHIESATGRLLAAVSAKEQAAISGKYLCAPGDVIYSKIRPYLRKATLATAPSLCSADMYPFTPHDDVNSRFLLALLLGESFSRFAESVSMRTGMPKINREELAECVVAWPSRCEQDQIVAVLDNAQSRQQAEIQEREKLLALKSGLMDDLLTGRVRVTPLLAAAATA